MNRRTRHGSGVQAPEEATLVPDDQSPSAPSVSEAPPPRGKKGQRTPKGRKAKARKTKPSTAPGFWGRAWSGLKLASGMAIVVAAALSLALGLRHYALNTPRFGIRALEVSGSKRYTEAKLAKLAGFEMGDNLLALDTDQAEKRLLEQPWIRSVKLSRRLPATLSIELVERDAAALAVIGDRLYLVTREGEPFKELDESDSSDLAIITGVSAENLSRDRAREIERISTAMQVLRQYERIPLSRVHPAQEVHIAKGGAVTLTVGKRGIALHLGHGPWRRKLLMAWRVMAKLAKRGQLPGIVFLDNEAHPERVVVRMR